MRLLAECPLDTGAVHSYCLKTSLSLHGACILGGDAEVAATACLRRRLYSQRTQLRAELMIEGHHIINSR